MGETNSEETKLTEALHILDKFASERQLGPRLQEIRRRAIKELFEELVTLDGKAGFVGQAKSLTTYIFGVGATARSVILFADHLGDGVRFKLEERTEQSTLIEGLRFNTATSKWEGMADDSFYVPIPGEPRARKRDALAVIVEALLPHLG